MSLLNVWVGRERAIVATDSIATLTGGTRTPCSKLHLLPHLGAVFSGRGRAGVALGVHAHLTQAQSFDAAAAALPGLAREMAAHVPTPKHIDDAGQPFETAGDELYLVGWSTTRGRMVCAVARSTGGEWQADEITDDFIYGPGLRADGELPPDLAGWQPDTPERMRMLAGRQLAVIESDFPELRTAFGGDLHCATVHRSSILLENMGAI